MIPVGSPAPDFTLETQFGKRFSLRLALQTHHVLMLWYPLDWTPTCSQEVPELEALAPRFEREANTAVVAISASDRYSHLAWGASLGGVSIPILADVRPYGGVSRAYGAWIPAEEISDRATVVIDRGGVVRYATSVGKNGRRNIHQLLDVATRIARAPQTRPAGSRA